MNADELPPGEYEILAMFDGEEGAPKPVGPIDRKDAAKSIAHHQVPKSGKFLRKGGPYHFCICQPTVGYSHLAG